MENNLTYYQDIKPMFGQWEVIQMRFYNKIDLWDYNYFKRTFNNGTDVLNNAELVYNSFLPYDKRDQKYQPFLTFPDTMPRITGPWPDEWIQKFKTWIDQGCEEGTPLVIPTADSETPDFIALSKILTGYDGTAPDEFGDPQHLAPMFTYLGPIYQDRIKKESKHKGQWDSLMTTWTEIKQLPIGQQNAAVATRIMATDGPLFSLAKDIITIWYLSSVNGTLGTPEYNQYQYGLVWQAIWAHPTGYADSVRVADFYWQDAPKLGRSKDLLFTGQNIPTFFPT
ncbi:MAG: hypothetical protein ACKVT2_21815 [Saprospiraceae bacterium]